MHFWKIHFQKIHFRKIHKNNWGPLSSIFHVGRPETLTEWKFESVAYGLTDGLIWVGTRDAWRLRIKKADIHRSLADLRTSNQILPNVNIRQYPRVGGVIGVVGWSGSLVCQSGQGGLNGFFLLQRKPS